MLQDASDLDIHLADLPVHVPLFKNWIEAIEECCDRFPHGYPADDEKTLGNQWVEKRIAGVNDNHPYQETGYEKCDPYQEA